MVKEQGQWKKQADLYKVWTKQLFSCHIKYRCSGKNTKQIYNPMDLIPLSKVPVSLALKPQFYKSSSTSFLKLSSEMGFHSPLHFRGHTLKVSFIRFLKSFWAFQVQVQAIVKNVLGIATLVFKCILVCLFKAVFHSPLYISKLLNTKNKLLLFACRFFCFKIKSFRIQMPVGKWKNELFQPLRQRYKSLLSVFSPYRVLKAAF